MTSRKTDKPSLHVAMLGAGELEFEGVFKDVKRSYYSLSFYVGGIKVAQSKKSKPRSSVVKLEWKENNQICFDLSSTVKIELHRGYQYGNILKVLVGKHEGKIANLLVENVTSFELTDKCVVHAVKLKTPLSPIPESGDTITALFKAIRNHIFSFCVGTNAIGSERVWHPAHLRVGKLFRVPFPKTKETC